MLKRNLFAIVITSLVLVFTSSAFGQWHPDIDRVQSPKDVATGQVKSPRDVASGQSTDIKAKSKPTTSMNELKNVQVTSVKKSSELLTEISFPSVKANSSESKGKYIGKWEGPNFDASKNNKPRIKPIKSKGYIGETEKN